MCYGRVDKVDNLPAVIQGFILLRPAALNYGASSRGDGVTRR